MEFLSFWLSSKTSLAARSRRGEKAVFASGLQLQVFLVVLFVCLFVGLELSSNLGPNIANEGYMYLRNLICDKVCRARKLKQQESNQVSD